MGVLETLKDLGGCHGGQVVYRLADTALEIRHPTRKRRRLRPETIARLQPLYPHVDLKSVDFVSSANLSVAELFNEGTDAITFGSRMWFKDERSRLEGTDDGLRLMMHELVHVTQYRLLGSSKEKFACAYGRAFLIAGSDYRKNPMEAEAYDFVRDNPVPPPAVPEP